MTVLVTGGAGYIGGHMVLALLDAGEKIVVLDDLSTGFRWAVPNTAKLIVGDVGDAVLFWTTCSPNIRLTLSPISPPRSWCPN